MTKERLELLSDDVIENLANKVGVRLGSEWTRESLINSIIDVMDEDRIEKESLLNLALSIESKKYSVTIDEELDLSYDVAQEMILPERYNDNMLHFVLRDNSWGFILWDIKDLLIQKYKKDYGNISPILRVIELGNRLFNKASIVDFFDIHIDYSEKCRYVNLPLEEVYYCVEFILLSETKEFIIERSQVVKTSRNHMNALTSENEHLKKIIELSGFSVNDIIIRKTHGLNRILPMDSMGEEA